MNFFLLKTKQNKKTKKKMKNKIKNKNPFKKKKEKRKKKRNQKKRILKKKVTINFLFLSVAFQWYFLWKKNVNFLILHFFTYFACKSVKI